MDEKRQFVAILKRVTQLSDSAIEGTVTRILEISTPE